VLPEGTRLLKNKEDIEALLLPMVPEFCESVNHRTPAEDVTAVALDLDNIQAFVFENDSEVAGFATISIGNAFGFSHLHHWHGYFKPEFRHLSGKHYDLTKALVERMEIDRISFTFFNKKVAKRVSQQLKKRGISLDFNGYFYQGIQKE